MGGGTSYVGGVCAMDEVSEVNEHTENTIEGAMIPSSSCIKQ